MLAFGAVAAQDATKKDANKITIDNFHFHAKELTVAVGTTVKWVNHDDIRHGGREEEETFRSKALTPRLLFRFVHQRRHVRTISAACIRHMSGKSS